MSHDHKPETGDRVALYALGTLPGSEAVDLERHLEGCSACRAEVMALRGVTADLMLLSPSADPPAGLRRRLLDRIRKMKDGEYSFVLAGEGAWEPSGWEGVWIRRLFERADRATMLVRMEPGRSYPPHRHAAAEECYVIQGDLQFDGIRMVAGDFVRAGAGSMHGSLSTEAGCLLMVSGHPNNEIVSSGGAS